MDGTDTEADWMTDLEAGGATCQMTRMGVEPRWMGVGAWAFEGRKRLAEDACKMRAAVCYT